jgi:hypothetical protein
VSASWKKNNLPYRKLHQETQVWCKRPLLGALEFRCPGSQKQQRLPIFGISASAFPYSHIPWRKAQDGAYR